VCPNKITKTSVCEAASVLTRTVEPLMMTMMMKDSLPLSHFCTKWIKNVLCSKDNGYKMKFFTLSSCFKFFEGINCLRSQILFDDCVNVSGSN
jgi:hypothetical protein